MMENGWLHRIADFEQFQQLIGNSQRATVSVGGDKIVGFARALCDELSNGYLSMIVVDPQYRR